MKSYESKKLPRFFWLPCYHDLICWAIYLVFAFSFYYYCKKTCKYNYFIIYQDSLNYYASAYLEITNKEHSEIRNKLPSLKLQSYLDMIFIKLLGSNYQTVIIASSITVALISIYLFNRFLKIYNLVQNPLFSTILYCFAPFFGTLFKLSACGDNLFFCFVLLSFIFYRNGNYLLNFVTIAISTYCRAESLILIFIFNILYIIKGRRLPMFIYLFGSVVGIFSLFYYGIYDRNFVRHLCLNKPIDLMVQDYPLHELFKNFVSIDKLRLIHGNFCFYAINLFSIICLYERSFPLFLSALIWFINSFFLLNQYAMRFMLPFETMAVIPAIDRLFTTRMSRLLTIPFLLVYIPTADVYLTHTVTNYDDFPTILFDYI